MRETNKAKQAFEDYFNMGPGRSLEKLRKLYQKDTDSAPTTRVTTLKQWSRHFGWQKRVEEKEAEIAAVAWEEVKTQATNTGYALYQKRLADLNDKASLLSSEIEDEDKRWPFYWKNIGTKDDPQLEQVRTFNAPLLREYRGLIGDIAAEMGERSGKSPLESIGGANLSIPAEMLIPAHLEVHRAVLNNTKRKINLDGGRGGLKSSLASLELVAAMINNPETHVLAMRQVANTLRDSVYSQFQWAIDKFGITSKFSFTKSPLEIKYLPTGQTIYFRGADDPGKIKSIKPPFGYIAWLWWEEYDQFVNAELVRNIVQSALRGGDIGLEFRTWNTPISKNHRVNKELAIPDDNTLHVHTTYLDVPKEWLGQIFIDEAEHLKEINPKAYEHEYLGIATGTGGMVFENVVAEAIPDEKIAQFDRVVEGMDFGWSPDPTVWVRAHLDAARETIYVYDEYRANKRAVKDVYKDLVEKHGIDEHRHLIIADSAEPRTIADLRNHGAHIRGAEKGPDSVYYSMRWLQGKAKIVVDPVRCPYTLQEMLNYELEKDKNGEYITKYPDRDNHFIDALRYAFNLIWRKRGQ